MIPNGNGHSSGSALPRYASIPHDQSPYAGFHDPIANRQLEQAVTNATSVARMQLLSSMGDPRRSVEDECGYPPPGVAISIDLYRHLYDRCDIANRAVQMMPKECMKQPPLVFESESEEDVTQFEHEWDQLGGQLGAGRSWYSQEEGSRIWEYIQRADILSRVGSFGIILLGVDDGKNMQEPVDGMLVTEWQEEPIKEKRRNPHTGKEEEKVVGLKRHSPTRRPVMPDSTITKNEIDAILRPQPVKVWTRYDTEKKQHVYNEVAPPPLSPEERMTVNEWRQERNLAINARKQARKLLTANKYAEAARVVLESGLPGPKFNWTDRERKQIGRGITQLIANSRLTVNTPPPPPQPPPRPGALPKKPKQPPQRPPLQRPTGQQPEQLGQPEKASPPMTRQGQLVQQKPVPGKQPQPKPQPGKKQAQVVGTDRQYGASEAFQAQGIGMPPPGYGDRGHVGGYGQLSGTDAQYYGVQFGQSEFPAMDPYGSPTIPDEPRGYIGLPKREVEADDEEGGEDAPTLQDPEGDDPDGPMMGKGIDPLPPDEEELAEDEGEEPVPGKKNLLGVDSTEPDDPEAEEPEIDPETGEPIEEKEEEIDPHDPSNFIDRPDKRKITFMRVYDESLVQVVRYEWNVNNPRFGMPVMYRVTLNDPREVHSGIGMPLATVFVHWSRVIHLADVAANAGSSEIFAPPVMRPILNRLLDCYKLPSAAAEGYWQSGTPTKVFSTHPQLGGDVLVNKSDLKDQVEQLTNSLTKVLLGRGGSWSLLAPSMIDPSPFLQTQIELICVQLACPVRIFKGAERGELASSQDDSNWNDRVQGRRNGYLTPRVICPLIDRLIMLRVLPEPKSYYVEWPDLESFSQKDKAGIFAQLVGALAAYMQSGAEALISPRDILTKFTVGLFSEEEVDAMLEAAAAHQEEAMSAQQDQMAMQAEMMGQQQGVAEELGLKAAPPEGFIDPEQQEHEREVELEQAKNPGLGPQQGGPAGKDGPPQPPGKGGGFPPKGPPGKGGGGFGGPPKPGAKPPAMPAAPAPTAGKPPAPKPAAGTAPKTGKIPAPK